MMLMAAAVRRGLHAGSLCAQVGSTAVNACSPMLARSPRWSHRYPQTLRPLLSPSERTLSSLCSSSSGRDSSSSTTTTSSSSCSSSSTGGGVHGDAARDAFTREHRHGVGLDEFGWEWRGKGWLPGSCTELLVHPQTGVKIDHYYSKAWARVIPSAPSALSGSQRHKQVRGLTSADPIRAMLKRWATLGDDGEEEEKQKKKQEEEEEKKKKKKEEKEKKKQKKKEEKEKKLELEQEAQAELKKKKLEGREVSAAAAALAVAAEPSAAAEPLPSSAAVCSEWGWAGVHGRGYCWVIGFDPLSGSSAVGAAGERCVSQELRSTLPRESFGPESWRSHYRACIGLPVDADEPDATCDFVFVDADGSFSGSPGTECFVEVKSSLDARPRKGEDLRLSCNQLAAAIAAHRRPDALFVLYRVCDAGAGGKPHVAYKITDPIEEIKEGRLRLEWTASNGIKLKKPKAMEVDETN